MLHPGCCGWRSLADLGKTLVCPWLRSLPLDPCEYDLTNQANSICTSQYRFQGLPPMSLNFISKSGDAVLVDPYNVLSITRVEVRIQRRRHTMHDTWRSLNSQRSLTVNDGIMNTPVFASIHELSATHNLPCFTSTVGLYSLSTRHAGLQQHAERGS